MVALFLLSQLKGTGVFSFIEKSRVGKEAAVTNAASAPKKPPGSKGDFTPKK
jgi:hypothetical protein